ncbi:MAG: nitroreductase, partial [Lachnospiraceae bacterium]|nr:nitroreductase [Lachnospiraceae bacterium]
VHFYEKHSRGYVAENGWDTQKIDMGIALCHFELAAEESGSKAVFEIADPGIAVPEDTDYIASYCLKGDRAE